MDEQAHLFYLVGASGAGKDTLLDYARRRLAGRAPLVFAHRYITRAPDAGGENHVALSPDEFANRRSRGLFAMHWHSHGEDYGVGIEIHQWLARGLDVVVNGSRMYLPRAADDYPELCPVLVRVSPAVLEARLRERGRERGAELEERLRRARAFGEVSHPRLRLVDNDGPVAEGGERLVSLLAGRRC